MHRALAELLAQAGVDRLRQAGLGARLVAADRDVVELRIDDPPLDEGIDEDVLLFRGDETLGFGAVEGQDALLEVAHVLDQRHLEVEPRLGDDVADFTELEDDRRLALIDGEDRRTEQAHERGHADAERIEIGFHQRTSRSRERSDSRERVSRSSCGGAASGCTAAAPDAADWAGRPAAAESVARAPAAVACISLSSGR